MKKFNKLSKAEMRKVTGGGDCDCNLISCESDQLNHGTSFYAQTACNQAHDACQIWEPGSIVIDCVCSPGAC